MVPGATCFSPDALQVTIRKQPCYWASLFTAANATEQDRYLMAPALGRDGDCFEGRSGLDSR